MRQLLLDPTLASSCCCPDGAAALLIGAREDRHCGQFALPEVLIGREGTASRPAHKILDARSLGDVWRSWDWSRIDVGDELQELQELLGTPLSTPLCSEALLGTLSLGEEVWWSWPKPRALHRPRCAHQKPAAPCAAGRSASSRVQRC